MRIFVTSVGAAINPQILAYAEYRLFAVLARYAAVRGTRVVLRCGAGGGVRCSVTIDFDSTSSARASVKGLHAVGAVDRAAGRIAELMSRRSQPDIAQ